jgi:hypothetical protein
VRIADNSSVYVYCTVSVCAQPHRALALQDVTFVRLRLRLEMGCGLAGIGTPPEEGGWHLGPSCCFGAGWVRSLGVVAPVLFADIERHDPFVGFGDARRLLLRCFCQRSILFQEQMDIATPTLVDRVPALWRRGEITRHSPDAAVGCDPTPPGRIYFEAA